MPMIIPPPFRLLRALTIWLGLLLWGGAPTPSVFAQEEIRVFTEEVRIPLFAFDEHGRFDPAVEMRDLLVMEDDVAQEIKSLRRLPASVLLLVGTGGELNPAMRTTTTRDIALNLVANLRADDHVALLQFTGRTELLHDWTTDKKEIARALRTKLHAGRGSHLAGAIATAATRFAGQPVGNRHVVLITDGVDLPAFADSKELTKALTAATSRGRDEQAALAAAISQLNAAQLTVHVISYTALARRMNRDGARSGGGGGGGGAPPGSVRASGIATAGIDPTLPPTMHRGGVGSNSSVGVGLTFDPAMRRLRKAYEKAMRQGESHLMALAEEMGGRIWLPASIDEMFAQGVEVAREVGSQYVMTYTPKRALANSPVTEYRRIRVIPRRSGLHLRTRRGYVVAAMR